MTAEMDQHNMQGGMPGWVALTEGGPPLQAPDWLLPDMPHHGTVWWRGVLSYLDPLIERCRGLPVPRFENYVAGANIEVHPTQPHLFTRCLVPIDCARTLMDHSGRFKFVKKGGRDRGAKVGCMKLKRHACGGGVPAQEVYISRLLCYMYRGPPPEPGLEACHLCENRMCMAPWHLVWASHSNNMKGYHVHKRNRKAYHPYPSVGAVPANA